jgi:hypothetical protein
MQTSSPRRKGAVICQIHLRGCHEASADGAGDRGGVGRHESRAMRCAFNLGAEGVEIAALAPRFGAPVAGGGTTWPVLAERMRPPRDGACSGLVS